MRSAAIMFALTSLLGCRGQESRALMGSGREPALIVRAERAAEPGEFGKIVRMPAREVAARLGAFRAAESSRLQASLAGQPVETLDESVQLEFDQKRQWHGLRNNSRESGFEAWAVAGTLVVRMRYAKPVQHRPAAGESERLCEDLFGDAAAYWDLIERFAELRDEGPAQAAGRPARRVRIGLRSSPRGAAEPAQPERKWRKDVVVGALTGSALIDQQTGAPLALDWKARYTYSRAGQPTQVEMELKREITDLGAVALIEVPRDAVASPVRVRWEVERRELLDGLAPGKPHGGR